jgi:hypothetical protein
VRGSGRGGRPSTWLLVATLAVSAIGLGTAGVRPVAAEPAEVGPGADRVVTESETTEGETTAASDGRTEAQSQHSPNDPLFSLQWYLEEIRAPEAWQYSTGTPQVTLAVIDTGVDAGHLDVWGSLWFDPRTGANGYDHLLGSTSTYVSPSEDWHGTAVAGIAIARTNDGRGMAGVAPRISLMVHRVYRSLQIGEPPSSGGSLARAAAAIDHAVADGAAVLLLSLGGPADDPALRDAIARAGVPVVVAAGNDRQDLSTVDASLYPAMYRFPNLVTVAASDRNGGLLGPGYTKGSNWGLRHVDLAAPGQDIVAPLAGGDDHLYTDGTSFAAPQVAAALALGRTLSPDATASELVGEVVRSARRTSSLQSRVTSGGVLDIAAFLEGMRRLACTSGVERGSFSDVPLEGAHAFNVDCIAWWGVAQGVDGTRFAPARPVTRGQMASFLARTLDTAYERPQDPPSAFTDTAGHPHEAAIDAVAAAGIAQGQADGRFLPDDPVTRAQMASFVVRTLEHVLDVRPPADRPWFDDVAGSVHRDNIVRAREWGITLGTSDPRAFLPGRTITREQMASFVARTLDEIARDGTAMRRLHP